MNEQLLRSRMLRGSCFLPSPHRETATVPSAGPEYIKKPKEGEAMSKYGKCGVCGRENIQLIGKGLCWKCRKEAIDNGSYEVRTQEAGLKKVRSNREQKKR